MTKTKRRRPAATWINKNARGTRVNHYSCLSNSTQALNSTCTARYSVCCDKKRFWYISQNNVTYVLVFGFVTDCNKRLSCGHAAIRGVS